MDDDDDDFMHDDDNNVDFDFEYEDNDEDSDMQDADIDLENNYYNAKGLKEEDIELAITHFQNIVNDDNNIKGVWGFRSLKQLIKIKFSKREDKEVLELFQQLLKWLDSNQITRNHADKSINNMLDLLSTTQNTTFLEKLYDAALSSISQESNSRVWTKTNLKLAELLLQHEEYEKLSRILQKLYASCINNDGSNNQTKGTLLLELYAIEIQMYTATKNHKKLKALYHKCLRVKSAVPHPKIMGIIRECGGKMHMSENSWQKAKIDFFEAFRNFDESGDIRRIQCLKYMVLANILMESFINPFDSQETKAYQSHKDIIAMLNLFNACRRKNIDEVDSVLSLNKDSIMGDKFIASYLSNLLRSVRTQVLLRLIEPYSKIKLKFISEQLNIEESEVESLIIELILDSKLNGKIDYVSNLLLLDSITTEAFNSESINEWITNINRKLIFHE